MGLEGWIEFLGGGRGERMFLGGEKGMWVLRVDVLKYGVCLGSWEFSMFGI